MRERIVRSRKSQLLDADGRDSDTRATIHLVFNSGTPENRYLR